MNVLLLQLDGSIPNLALMRLASWHRSHGDYVELRQLRNGATVGSLRCELWDLSDRVYASLIFERTRPLAETLQREVPGVILGGTGWSKTTTLADVGVDEGTLDYADYPHYRHSIGFTQRGCRLKCSFCVVPEKEPELKKVATVADIWRGDPFPRNVLLLDNDFFGVKEWPREIERIRDGGFKVCWNQGLNVRLIGDEEAAAVASVGYYDDQFTRPRLYTAWDNRKDEARLFRNLETLVKYGVRPDNIMVYMLIGFWDGPHLTADDFYRHKKLREFGCRPYPMPFVKTRELNGFQKWVVKRIDVAGVSWEQFRRAKYRPEKIGLVTNEPPLFASL